MNINEATETILSALNSVIDAGYSVHLDGDFGIISIMNGNDYVALQEYTDVDTERWTVR